MSRGTLELELALRAADGDQGAFERLARRFGGMLHLVVSRYFLAGAEREDLEQEALIGLHKATLSFDPGRGAQFATFARLCVERQVLSALKRATSGRQEVLTHAVRLDEQAAAGEPDTLLGLVAAPEYADPAVRAVARDRLRRLLELCGECSALERTVLARVLSGATLAEAGQGLGKGRPGKVADNALNRVRRRARRRLEAA